MKKFLFFIILMALIAAGVYYTFFRSGKLNFSTISDVARQTGAQSSAESSANSYEMQDSAVAPATDYTPAPVTALTGKTSAALMVAAQTLAAKDFNKPFADSGLHMAFSYPDGLGLEENQEGNSTIVTVVETKTGVGFQVEVSPFDDADTSIGVDRIKKDIPDIVIQRPETVTIVGSKPGTTFISTHGSQLTREVWFAREGLLYQVTAPLEFDPFTKKMLSTWKFI